jgi:hypothetical protein
LGVPVTSTNMDFLRGVLKPKLIIQGTRDQFGSRAQVESFYGWRSPNKSIGCTMRIISSRGSSRKFSALSVNS